MLQYNDLKVETLRHHNLVLCLLCHLDAFKFFSFLRNSLLLKKKKKKERKSSIIFSISCSFAFTYFLLVHRTCCFPSFSQSMVQVFSL